MIVNFVGYMSIVYLLHITYYFRSFHKVHFRNFRRRCVNHFILLTVRNLIMWNS